MGRYAPAKSGMQIAAGIMAVYPLALILFFDNLSAIIPVNIDERIPPSS